MRSEVEAGDVTLARVFVHGMHVALAKEHIHFRVEFNLGTVGGIKKHTVPNAHLAHVATGGDNVCPREPGRNVHCRRDENAGLAAALTLGIGFHEQSVVEHPQGKRGCVAHFWR